MYSSPEVETLLKTIDIDTTKKLFSMFTNFILSKSYDNPSNMSYVLKYYNGLSYQWTFPMGECPNFLKPIVDELFKL